MFRWILRLRARKLVSLPDCLPAYQVSLNKRFSFKTDFFLEERQKQF